MPTLIHDSERTGVLIADDDEDEFLIFSIAIEETKLAVDLTHAKDGVVLLQMLEENIPDILFLDIMMPCMNGRECLKEIRSNARYDHLPVIMYSAFSDLNNIDYCFRERANLYAVKPVVIAELSAMLKRILTMDWKKMYYPARPEFTITSVA